MGKRNTKPSTKKILNCVLICNHPLGIIAYLAMDNSSKTLGQLVIEGKKLEDYYDNLCENGFVIDDSNLAPEVRKQINYFAPIVDQRRTDFVRIFHKDMVVSVASIVEYYHLQQAKVGQKINGTIIWDYKAIQKHRKNNAQEEKVHV